MDQKDVLFKEIFDKNSKKIFHLCYGYTGDKDSANDLLQETFLKVWQNLDKFRNKSLISTWIYRISVNKCQEFLRKKMRKKRFGFIIPIDKAESTIQISSNFMHPGFELENQERGAILFAAINALPENQKTAFTLFNLESIPYEEIAQIMNTSLSAVESLIFRARQNLKKSLSDYYEENER